MSMERDVEDTVPYGCGKREPTIPPPTSLCSATSPINGGGKGNGLRAVPICCVRRKGTAHRPFPTLFDWMFGYGNSPAGRRGCVAISAYFFRLWAIDQKISISSSEVLSQLRVMVWGMIDAEMEALM